MPQQLNLPKEEWLKVLTKGLITIPKIWREELGLQEGNIVKAKKTANRIILEVTPKKAPYRIYTKNELQQFLNDDQI